jgi:hypothetical protein
MWIMLSNITFKYVALLEIELYKELNKYALVDNSPCVYVDAVAACLVDVFIDTVKYPVIALENAAFAAINFCGSLKWDQCTVADGSENVKKAVVSLFVATPVMTLLSPFKLVDRLCVVLSDPAHAKPSNREAEKEANQEAIIWRAPASQSSLA